MQSNVFGVPTINNYVLSHSRLVFFLSSIQNEAISKAACCKNTQQKRQITINFLCTKRTLKKVIKNHHYYKNYKCYSQFLVLYHEVDNPRRNFTQITSEGELTKLILLHFSLVRDLLRFFFIWKYIGPALNSIKQNDVTTLLGWFLVFSVDLIFNF